MFFMTTEVHIPIFINLSISDPVLIQNEVLNV